MVELVQAGAMGDVTEVHVWVGKGWGGGERPEGGQDPPANLNWDLWLGPAPERPYWPGKYHPAKWRRWWDFGQGTLGDMACHYMDLPFWALKLRHPTHCEAEGPAVHPETCPLGLKVRYQFPERDGLAPVEFTWYDGNLIPKEVAGEQVPRQRRDVHRHRRQDVCRLRQIQAVPRREVCRLPAARTDDPRVHRPPRRVDQGLQGRLANHLQLRLFRSADRSRAAGQRRLSDWQSVEWDAKNLKATNCPEADQYIRKKLPGWLGSGLAGRARFLTDAIFAPIGSAVRYSCSRIRTWDAIRLNSGESSYDIRARFSVIQKASQRCPFGAQTLHLAAAS